MIELFVATCLCSIKVANNNVCLLNFVGITYFNSFLYYNNIIGIKISLFLENGNTYKV